MSFCYYYKLSRLIYCWSWCCCQYLKLQQWFFCIKHKSKSLILTAKTFWIIYFPVSWTKQKRLWGNAFSVIFLLNSHGILAFTRFFSCHRYYQLTARFGLIMDQLCYSQPCVAVLIFYSELLLAIRATSPSVFLSILKFFSLPPSPCDCPGRSCPGAYLLVLHVPRVLIETACSCSTDILLYNTYSIGAKYERIILLLSKSGV